MDPSAFLCLEAFPLNPNGKLDRRALPVPDLETYATHLYVPPRGEVEMTLAGIWQELLHVSQVGRHHDFFELGGHSLSAMRVIARIRQSLGIAVAPRVLFNSPTLERFARNVETLIWLKSSAGRSRQSEMTRGAS
jgi:acyl carrier protein